MEIPPQPTHIGTMIAKYIRKNRFYRSAMARDMSIRRESLDYLLKRPDSRVSNLWKMSYALNYNFLADIAVQLPAQMPCQPNAKDKRIAELEKQVQELTTECNTLQRVVEALQKK